MKKVYFACSIRGGRDDGAIYAEIIELLKEHAEVLSELFGDKNLTSQGHIHLSNQQIWEKDMAWLRESDAVIAEVTNPSLGVGYEIAKAEELKKPVLVLYRPQPGKRLSAMIAGAPGVQVTEYQRVSELKETVANFVENL